MRHVVVRYKVKPERLAEHEALLAAVFAELAERAPAGLSYQAMKLGDGLGFVHVASMTGPDNPLASLPAFKAFTAGIASRCEEPPVSSETTLMGVYPGRA